MWNVLLRRYAIHQCSLPPLGRALAAMSCAGLLEAPSAFAVRHLLVIGIGGLDGGRLKPTPRSLRVPVLCKLDCVTWPASLTQGCSHPCGIVASDCGVVASDTLLWIGGFGVGLFRMQRTGPRYLTNRVLIGQSSFRQSTACQRIFGRVFLYHAPTDHCFPFFRQQTFFFNSTN